MSRKKYYTNAGYTDTGKTYTEVLNRFIYKYYGLFVSSIQWDNITPEQSDYIMREFWDVGTVSAFQIPEIEDEVAFAPYVAQSWTMYDTPKEVSLINHRNAPFFPTGSLVVNKDVVLGYFLDNHRPVSEMVKYYCTKLADIEMTIRTNLAQQKLPWIINVNPANKDKMEDVLDQIMNNQPVVFTDLTDDELASFQINETKTPFLLDKLTDEVKVIEGELMTMLGVDNMNVEKKERLITDEATANNQEINMNANSHERRLTMFTDKIQEVFGVTIGVISSKMDTEAEQEDTQEGNTGSLSDENEKEDK